MNARVLPVLGVAIAIAGIVAGTAWQSSPARLAEREPARMLVVGVGGMSWETLLELEAAERLPRFAERLANEAYGADLSPGMGESGGSVLASLVTGKSRYRHGIDDFAQAGLFRDEATPDRTTLWQRLSRGGDAIGLVGLPFWAPLDSREAWVVPDWEIFSRDHRVWRGTTEQATPPGWDRHLVRPESLPEERWRKLVDAAGDATLEPIVREALAADLTMLGLAGEIFDDTDGGHVFVYLEGLRHVESASPDAARSYHAILEELLARLELHDDGNTTFLVFSEQGSRPAAAQDAAPPPGWVLAWGRGIKQAVDPLTVTPVDIAATLLYLAGDPVPDDIDGTIQFDMLRDDFFRDHPVQVEPGS